jgi:hypothetical protein
MTPIVRSTVARALIQSAYPVDKLADPMSHRVYGSMLYSMTSLRLYGLLHTHPLLLFLFSLLL